MIFTTIAKNYSDVTTLDDTDLICYCTRVNKKSIVDAIDQGATTTLKQIKEMTTACTGDECTTLNPNKRCCSKEINQLIKLNKEKNDGKARK